MDGPNAESKDRGSRPTLRMLWWVPRAATPLSPTVLYLGWHETVRSVGPADESRGHIVPLWLARPSCIFRLWSVPSHRIAPGQLTK